MATYHGVKDADLFFHLKAVYGNVFINTRKTKS